MVIRPQAFTYFVPDAIPEGFSHDIESERQDFSIEGKGSFSNGQTSSTSFTKILGQHMDSIQGIIIV